MPETKGNPASPAENGAMTSYVVRWPHFGHNSHIDLEEQMKTARNKTASCSSTENSCSTNANHYHQIDHTQYEHHNQLGQPSAANQPPGGCEWLMQSMPRSIPELRRDRNSLKQI